MQREDQYVKAIKGFKILPRPISLFPLVILLLQSSLPGASSTLGILCLVSPVDLPLSPATSFFDTTLF